MKKIFLKKNPKSPFKNSTNILVGFLNHELSITNFPKITYFFKLEPYA